MMFIDRLFLGFLGSSAVVVYVRLVCMTELSRRDILLHRESLEASGERRSGHTRGGETSRDAGDKKRAEECDQHKAPCHRLVGVFKRKRADWALEVTNYEVPGLSFLFLQFFLYLPVSL
jgi:hypothetical protein